MSTMISAPSSACSPAFRHDAQFTAPQRQLADSYGHSTVDDALTFASRCGARRLVLTHHAPDRTDDELDDLARYVVAQAPDVTVGIQGAVVDLR